MPTVESLPAVAVSKRVFDKLMNYSTSIPTGTTIGKWWKRESPRGSGNWRLGCYGPCKEDPKMVTIHWRRLTWYPWVKDGEALNAADLPPLDKKASFH